MSSSIQRDSADLRSPAGDAGRARPARPRDARADADALRAAVLAMSDAPQTVLRVIAAQARTACGAESAGVSLVVDDPRAPKALWDTVDGRLAVAGLRAFDLDACPCGEAVRRDVSLVFDDPTAGYPALEALPLPVTALLMTPLRREGRPFGTLWLAQHAPGAVFDAGDVACVELLARTASAAPVAGVDEARAEEAWRQSEQRLRLATAAADVGTWDLDPASGRLIWDAAVKRHFGLPPEADIEGYDTFVRGLHPDDRARVDAAVQAALRGQRPDYDITYRTIGLQDGLERHIAARGRALHDEQGRVVRFVGTTLDITAEHAIAESLRVLDALSVAAQAATTAAEVMALTTRQLGESLNVTRCAYADVAADELTFTIREEWTTATTSVGSEHRLDTFGADAVTQLRSGRTLVLGNVETDVVSPLARGAFREAAVGAVVCCPLLKGGRLVSLVLVLSRTPRVWMPAEITLVKAVTERSGAHIERARVEASLRESEERYRLVGDVVNDAIWDWDLTADVIVWNRGMATAFGYDLGETTDVGWWLERVHPDDRARVTADLDTALAGDATTMRVEYRLRRADGTYAEVLDRARIVRRPDGTAHRMVGAIQDLTEMRRADAGRRESEAFMRQLVEHSPDCIKVLDPEARILTINAYGLRQLGIDDFETVRGRDWRTFWSGGDRVAAGRVFAEAVEGGSARFEGYCPTQTGEPRWWSVVATALTGGDTPPRVLVVSRDVTDSYRATLGARFLADASASLHDLSDPASTPRRIAELAVGAFADRCVIHLVDGATRRRIAAWADRAAARAHVAAVHVAPPPEADADAAQVFETGRPVLVTSVADALREASGRDARLDGLRDRGVRSYLCVPLVERGDIVGAMAFYVTDSARNFTQVELDVATDLARRVAMALENGRLYRSIQESDQRKSEFLATLAHELRNPLAPIRTGLEVLARTGPSAPDGERVRAVMTRQMGHMVRLVDDLLDVSRLSRGKLELRKQRVTLEAILRDAIESSQPYLDAASHRLRLDLPDAPVALFGDPTRLSQIVANLLTNAAKYTPDGGEIAVRAALDGGQVVIAVSDTGIGLTPEQVPLIFEMFGQVRTADHKAEGGLGIGLTLVKQLAEMHGGDVSAHSDGPRQGSTFEVRLPTADTPAPTVAPEPGPREVPRALKVLVVDDNVDSAEMLGLLIGMHGHEARSAFSGAEALDVAEAFVPDVVFLDIGLPTMSGYEVAGRLRQSPSTRDSLLVALTGWGAPEHVERSRAAGFDVHMTKPVDTDEVQRLLAHPDAARRRS